MIRIFFLGGSAPDALQKRFKYASPVELLMEIDNQEEYKVNENKVP